MNVRSIPAVLVFVAAVITAVANRQATGATVTSGMIQLVDQLDEAPDGQWYCADVLGTTPVEEGDAVQAHTCTALPLTIAEDQEFTPNSPMTGQIEITQVPGLCVQAQRVAAGAWLHALPCTMRDDRRQMWVAGADGEIHPASDTSLCWAVTVGDHGRCGNPDCSNFKRNVQLQDCATTDGKYLKWSIPGGLIGP